MFNLGLPELIIVGAVALLVFGPKKLPELAKSLGKGLRDFKKALEGGGADEEPKADAKPGHPAHPEILPGEGPRQARVDTPSSEAASPTPDPDSHKKS